MPPGDRSRQPEHWPQDHGPLHGAGNGILLASRTKAGGVSKPIIATERNPAASSSTAALLASRVPLERPRLRRKGGGTALESYQLFQQDGRMQRAVARKLLRQVSTRNYAGVLLASRNDCLAGYGVTKSSVSRHWKVATATELEKLCQREVPKHSAGQQNGPAH